jgi:hypothetical protein
VRGDRRWLEWAYQVSTAMTAHTTVIPMITSRRTAAIFLISFFAPREEADEMLSPQY